jgi:hypothetical protein
MSGELLNLPAMARTLRVSQSWLRREAEAKRVPALEAGPRRFLFCREAVERCLAERAADRPQEVAR